MCAHVLLETQACYLIFWWSNEEKNCGLTADFAQTPKCVYFAEKVHKVFQITANFIAAYTTLNHNKSFTKYE
jgi:hypothetical protein